MNTAKVQIEFNQPRFQAPVALQGVSSAERPPSDLAPMDFHAKRGDAVEAGTVNSRLVGALAGSVIFREYQKAFGDATGLPLTLRAVEGWQLAHQGNPNQNGFCALMSQAN